MLLQGDNVLAFEVHQSSLGSSDVVMGMSFVVQEFPPLPPVIKSEPASVAVFPNHDTSIFVGVQGPSLRYAWYFNGSLMEGETGSTLALTSVSIVAGGSYFAVVSNAYGMVTSRTAVV